MNRLKEVLAASLISVFGVAAFMLFATTSNAVTFPVFDHMDGYAQAEFIADMVDRTEKALRDDGKPDLASKTEQLFNLVEPGDKLSLGLAELERNVARARVADLDRLEKDPKARRVQVEDALFVTLKKNGIEMSDNALNSVLNAMASFHEMTNAEFRAQTSSEQRHIIQLFSDLAFPDYRFRDMLETHKSSFLGLGDKSISDLAEVMSTQFPSSGEQPGFRNVQNAVETENAKAPNHPVFPTLLIYVLDELEKGVDARNQDLVDRSVLLPDGRHAYIDDEGAFWIYPSDESKAGAKYKLEANLQPLARRLAECMKTGGITDGRRAQAVCLERVAGVRPPSTAPAAPPPVVSPAPAAAPLADEDHPIFLVVMCVAQNLLEKYSYNNPPAGGKMAAFESITERYIRSVAKPGWEYWIEEAQFENFDAQTSAPEALVSQISPESGRFDTSHPDCPSNYKWYQLPIKR